MPSFVNKILNRLQPSSWSVSSPNAAGVDVLFVPHNGYHTYELHLICPFLDRFDISYMFLDIQGVYRNEGAREKMKSLCLRHIRYHEQILQKIKPKILFVMNDWEPIVRGLVEKAKCSGVKTLGLIEGVQDYQDTHISHLGIGQIRNPYTTVDLPLLVGDYDRKFFMDRKVHVVGSTRIENLTKERKEKTVPKNPLVIINSNFTHGLYTSIQKQWLSGVIRACEELRFDYLISKHPADKLDLSSYRNTRLSLYEALRKGSVLVSRFSGAMLECMALGKPVIYHNPHGEQMDTFQNAKGAFPITGDVDSLKMELRRLSMKNSYDHAIVNDFFTYHVSIQASQACGERITNTIKNYLITSE